MVLDKTPDKIDTVKDIYDNVIGFVGITKLELDIISTPIFQRLRNIKQLGIAHYVFPGALQTRFNHSIGVLHYADQMVCSLQKKDYLKGSREKIRIAALLHDIGHYPLSHITEKAIIKDAKSIQPTDKLTLSDEISESIDTNSIQLNGFTHPTHDLNLKLHPNRNPECDYAHHERISNLVIEKTEIKQILNEYFKDDTDIISQIQRIISGIDASAEKGIIHSELDADKFDYLARDSHQTGVTYGIFDDQQIIRHLELSKEGELVAGTKSKRAVEHYLMSKYFLYSQVIHHKTVASFNFMAEQIYAGLLERGIAWSYADLLDKFDDDCHPTYLTFDDEYFFNLMKKVDNQGIESSDNSDYKINDEILTTYIKMVLNRQRLKLVDERQILSKKNKPRKIKEFSGPDISSICQEANIKPWWFIQNDILVEPTKSNPYKNLDGSSYFGTEHEAIKVITTDFDGNKIAKLLIEDESSIIKPLSLHQLNINRVYTKDGNYAAKLKIAIKKHRVDNYQ